MISKHNAEHYVWGEGCDGWRLVDQPELSIIHERMPPGTAEVLHKHHNARQFFFVLVGIATFEIDSTYTVLHAQQGIEIAPGVPHQIRNESDDAIEFLVTSQPTTRGDRYLAATL